jgi:phosphate transport system substrate-binding protein
MVNKDGQTVSATPEAIMAAAGAADWGKAPGFYMILTDSPGAKAWPIAGATFILVPKQPKDIAATKEALAFFAWAYKNGDEMASSLDYIPMPDNVVSLIQAKWKSEIRDDSGKPVF